VRRVAAAGAALLLALGAVLTVRAALLSSRQLDAPSAEPAPVDTGALARQLARAIRHRTVSHYDRERVETGALRDLHDDLERLFPRVHASLRRERIADWSLLYTWPGSDASLPPALFAAHLDVVPVDPASEEDWEVPPFAGRVQDGVVWGRGALDDKGSVVALLHAVEALLAEGFAPRRTILLAFGHDEEVGGHRGAAAIAAELARRGDRLAFALDEGGMVAEGVLPMLERPVALVGVAEKGSVSVSLSARAAGGHSSMPPRHTAVGAVASAVHALESRRPPARLPEATRSMLRFLAPELPFTYRLFLGNLWLLERPLLWMLATSETLDPAIRTTTAATLFHGGTKENVLPRRAEAVVNFRILPGDDVAGVLAHVRRSVDDARVRVATAPGTTPREPTSASPVDGPAFALLQRAIASRFPDAVTVPYLVLGGTDARHYGALTRHVYRFLPLRVTPASRALLHGRDERVDVAALAEAVRFYRDVFARAQEPLAGD